MNNSNRTFWASRSIPPYSTDPSLSQQRHADPEYVNSSEPTTEYTSDQFYITTDVEFSNQNLPSSPPKNEGFEMDACMMVDMADNDDAEDATDDDDDDDATDEDLDTAGHTSTFQDGTLRSFQQRTLVKGAFSECTVRPESFVMAARAESSYKRTAESVVAAVFDNERIRDINLDNIGLECIPVACKDLIDHEDLDRRTFRLDLSGNRISRISKFLYEFRRLEYLSLRFNSIMEITPLVSQLTGLRELHLGNNLLETLPAELLSLPNFQTLTTYPNNFIEPPKDGTTTRLVVIHKIPSLAELASREIAKAGFHQDFTEFEKTINHLILQLPELMLQRLLEPIVNCVNAGKVCSICMTPIIKPMAYHLYWTRHGEDRSGETVPFKTVLCSSSCLNYFKSNNIFNESFNERI